jgi:cell division protease FtsH
VAGTPCADVTPTQLRRVLLTPVRALIRVRVLLLRALARPTRLLSRLLGARAAIGRSGRRLGLPRLLGLVSLTLISLAIVRFATLPVPTPAGTSTAPHAVPVSVTAFIHDVTAGHVTTAVLDQDTDLLTASIQRPFPAGTAAQKSAAQPFAARKSAAAAAATQVVTVTIPTAYVQNMIADLITANVPFTVTTPSSSGATDGYPVDGSSANATSFQTTGAQTTGSQTGGGEAGTALGAGYPETRGVVYPARIVAVGGIGKMNEFPINSAVHDPQSRKADPRDTDVWEGIFALLLGLGTAIAAVGTSQREHRRLVTAAAGSTGLTAAGSVSGGSAAAALPIAGRRGRSAGELAEPAPIPADRPTTRFADVAGCDEAIFDLAELVMFLRDPDRFTRTGATSPKGALLVGPPGTGKTLLARAVAGEADVAFFAAAGSDFVEKYVGVGAQRVRDLFAAARAHEKAIIFIDEIDAVARARSGDNHGSVEGDNTLIALLAEMDGFTASGVIVLAATNRADILDPALTRPGRLDRRVEVPNPDRRGREQILTVHTAGKPVDDVDLVALARRTPGFSGAQLKALVNEACLDAVRRDLPTVTADCFDHAVATIAMGRARTSALVTDHDREVTAWHEGGHTMAAYLLPDADDPVQVTIVPRGPAGGVTWMSGSDDIFLTRRKAHAQLVVALAGRAAEEVLLGGEFTQGASGDLQTATGLAHQMATQFGMTRLGYQVRGQGQSGDPELADVVEELLAHAHAEATQLMVEHRDFLTAIAAALLDRDSLTRAEVAALAGASGITGPVTVHLPLPNRAVRRLPDPAEDRPAPAPVDFTRVLHGANAADTRLRVPNAAGSPTSLRVQPQLLRGCPR